MKFSTIKYTESENKIGKIIFNRPKSLNALNSKMLEELDLLLDELSELKALILTGSGKAFVAGADIKEMKNLDAFQAGEFSELGNKVCRKIEKLPFPVIAMVNGFALGGGCELAMSCDLRIASEAAKFGQPEVSLGVIPGFGGTQRLTRIIGASKAKELIFTGKMISAKKAYEIGLVNKIVKLEELETQVNKLTAMISKNSQKALSLSKEAIDIGLETDIDSGIKIEKNLFGLCFSNRDQEEGMLAFLEKRKPNFN